MQLGIHRVVESFRCQAGCVDYTTGMASPKGMHSGLCGGVGTASGV